MKQYGNYFFYVCAACFLLMFGCDNSHKDILEEKEIKNSIIESDIENVNIANESEENISINDDDNNKSLESENYAIYPFSIVENNETEINNYVHYEREIHVDFPQFFYSNEFEGYNEDIEAQINHALFTLSMRNDDSFLYDRDRGLREYDMDYIITKAEGDLVSIRYEGYLYSVSHAQYDCYGITFNYKTGELAKITDYITVDDSLISGILDKSINCFSAPVDEEEFVINCVTEFIDDYNDDNLNIYNCFYIDQTNVYIIIPVSQGNSSYLILQKGIE